MTETQEKIVTIAKKYIGVPYKYGATKQDIPNAFDCSLFTQHIYSKLGIELPRSTIEQAAIAQIENNISKIEPGDLIFLHGTRGHYNAQFPQGVGHVAMFIGDSKIIHATSERIQEKPVIIEKGGVEIKDLSESIEKGKFIVCITRPLSLQK